MSRRVTAIVPTLGWSPWLAPCLEALKREGGTGLEILLVAPRSAALGGAEALADRVLRTDAALGFAAANNLAFAASEGELIALVNDDAVVEPGWLAILEAALDADPEVAAAQGTNLDLENPRRIDGCGLAWNRWWQAVQLRRGEEAARIAESDGVEPIFGVSATAALYRRSMLPEPLFDTALDSYYEDVDLAVRLRRMGHGALWAASARARHAGSASGKRRRFAAWPLIYGNRYLVLARLLGRELWIHLPRIAARDLLDLFGAARSGEGARMAGIVLGWGRALAKLGRFIHRGRRLPVEGGSRAA